MAHPRDPGSSLPDLCRFSTQELLDECERRSLGMLCVCLRVEEHPSGFGDTWHYRIKGSNIMLGAMSAAITIKMQKELEKRGGEE
ncbi:MAG: hypothetical protein KIS92_26085 [Planctomycetota bacterium]|nr:hypothetical protein [Planctomycetota bacterium]